MSKLLVLLLMLGCIWACERAPSIYQSKKNKLPGDNGYAIKISGDPEKYMPGNFYTMYVMGSKSFPNVQKFSRFTISIESANASMESYPQNVGNFQLYDDDSSKFNEECVNTISETTAALKSEVFFTWSAPPPGSGCVVFKAMVLEDSHHWYADDGELTKTFCELTDKDMKFDENDCCACDEAKYNLQFEGIWSKSTHPKDFPFSLWLTHFSDVIGASHERNFSFWGEGHIASEGFRSLAEWGSVRLMEIELKAKAKFLRTIIKAAGLWYPNVNTITSSNFKVDRRHHLISLASMFGPSPDWVVGVNGLNLCLKNCTWIENLTVDLFPYDAGTDNGISYMSPNAETKPREKMYRITTTYPEDPRAPFYNPSKPEMIPLAKIYLKREKIIPKNCDESFLSTQLDISENTEDVSRAECAVTEYSDWSECSVTCGKGLRMRTREYKLPQKAAMFKCSRQLVSKEMCVAAVAECENTQNNDESEEDMDINSLDDTTGICNTSPWGPWSECSESCGVGFKMRTRDFIDVMGRKKCLHVTVVEKEKCMGPPCTGSQVEIKDTSCPTSDWTDWSPCSTSCGEGISIRTRFTLAAPELRDKCSNKIEYNQKRKCIERPICNLEMAEAKVACMQDFEQGPCDGFFDRWYFDSKKLKCLQFQFGGCRGNRNNFVSEEECEASCKVVKDALSLTAPVTSKPIPNYEINPVDCVVSEWSDWTTCSATCGPGIQTRNRKVLVYPGNGGKLCPVKLIRRRRCYGPVCA